MGMELEKKYSNLKELIAGLKQVVVAYSGGVDSTFLLKVALDQLNENVTAIMGKSVSMPEKEFEEAVALARGLGIEPVVIRTDEINLPDYYTNPTDRCYHCKHVIFEAFKKYVSDHSLKNLVDGSNYDDLSDYRPGKKALEETGVISPLKETGFSKEDIRTMSKKLNLPTWNKEAMACLSTRIAYGEIITNEKLKQISRAETYLRELGFTFVRVRVKDMHCKIETNPEQLALFFQDGVSKKVVDKLKKIGYKTVSIDLEGYRMGSMNDWISDK